jgi:hypothetical protein
MAFVPTAGRRRAGSARTSAELVSKAAGYGAFAFAFAFTCALVLGLIP